ncbi:MAG: GatB/YqeY domain-containing protein [Patescibacteria group bacterium]|jgi:hypothetical protein
MSSLIDKIEQDYITAYKAKAESKISTLRLLRSALKNASIESKDKLSDEEIFRVIKREIKQRDDAATQYRQAGREDLATKEMEELEILSAYLPAQLSDEEIRSMVQATIEELGATGPSQFGKVIGSVMSKTKGKADGSRVAKIVRELL